MSEHKNSNSWTLALVALGVVFGDIGTSPLYALRESLNHARPHPGVPLDVLGPLSLMFWSLLVMVCFKYLGFITRATNQGEGGMFALLTLFRSAKRFKPQTTAGVVLGGIFGACLLYGDGMITPAISVLSAVEGLALLDAQLGTDLAHYVVPISAGIILALFLVQKNGTARIGVAFGPIMVLWFATLAILGIINIGAYPGVFSALLPHHGVNFLLHHGHESFVLMGLVLLAVTGCEAMYADIGHFGRPPLVKSWYVLVLPALMLNYLGQGALVLSNVEASLQPDYHHFFSLVPKPALIPVILLATAATIIASQAMITGVYSLTQQAVQLGYLPRLKIIHTNPDVRGQIYMPQVNYLLMIACLALVFNFKSSSNLAAAYGLSVALDMTFTSILFFLVARNLWKWALWKAALPTVIFLVFELGYVSGSLLKFVDGAWFPLAIGLGMWIIMKTWMDGRQILYQAMLRGRLPVSFLVDEIKKDRIIRVPGTAVFMSASAEGLPLALLHHLKHNKALHKQVVLLTIRFEEKPHVPEDERFEVEEFHDDFFRVVLHYGFSESPAVFEDLCEALETRGKVKKATITFYQSREVLLTNGPGKMAPWRKKLFVILSRISRPATGYFDLPPRQVIELGIQLEV
ncbi:MAG: KUP/HAK/KT family potassium transporter [Prosthecobacter sp.]|jgi:KUP system potassium uptake protein|uniref:potassium transporter Kup n=1 Tax=Prosthecobacter sp. TaxID=1965333 RepID=UPI0019EE3C8A|nr:KUP/HAK/KT family potassium transporter [Prosthecobacter sp.]MBE2287645.1 KUP/HAK/KT family potassium transporter [Prosthecobacter sp.]